MNSFSSTIFKAISNIEYGDDANENLEKVADEFTKILKKTQDKTNVQQIKNTTFKTQEKQEIRNKINKLCRENIWL